MKYEETPFGTKIVGLEDAIKSAVSDMMSWEELADRVLELESQLTAARAETEYQKSLVEQMDVINKSVNEKLTAAAERERILNPCGHTGFESAPCAICGYPDPLKYIAALVERERKADEHFKESVEMYMEKINKLEERERVLRYSLTKLREYLMGSSWREIKSPDEFIRAALAQVKGSQ